MVTPKNKLKILLVDDSAEFIDAIRRFLDTQSWAEVVGHAYNGADAVARTADLKPDLVLLDIVMPGMSGFVIAKALQTQPQPPRIVFLSLHNASVYRAMAHTHGAAGFVSKADFCVELFPLLETLAAGTAPEFRP